MPPIHFSRSSEKHGIPEADQRHAIANPTVVQLVEPDVLLIIGHPHGQTDRLIEILVRALPSGDKNVFHAMELGPKFRPFLEETQA
ncbi:hypothetical protein EDF46_0939 [Frondihabitans sp. PhB188]|uniref:hypothetical protein n=1 Tax=Frondihabitans sp. PhB188 TaxID=2485200 RepID=UPI000F94C8AE|nr:hypothetical protein [Frondihabitans sp. PhB188]ROQ41558.1 hypothetical protein EDF46_0939 [Frondihabitans sp. PhB188]